MLRLLPILTFALLPAAVAAPVPRGVRPEFGATGIVTRAELEKVVFAPRPAGLKEPNGPFAERIGRDVAPLKGFEKAAVAVHLPWHTFREGEPVYAFFVFKNGGDAPLALDGRFNLFGPRPHADNGCALHVFDRKDGDAPVLAFGEGRAGAARVPAVIVPAGGFYCVRYNIGHRIDRRPLPPGEYEVDWQYAELRSAPVRFTVVKGEGDARPGLVPPNPRVHSYRVVTDDARERRPARAGDPFVWAADRLHRIYTGDVAAALGAGHAGVYVPDVHTIPAADARVVASVAWKPYRDGDRVAVTLAARDPRAPVRFADRPRLYLQVHTDTEGDLDDPTVEQPADAPALTDDNLVTPLVIELRLPTGWRERTGLPAASRVAVVVTSSLMELPQNQPRAGKVKEVVKRPADGAPVWEGVLRTPFTDLRFPPPLLPGSQP